MTYSTLWFLTIKVLSICQSALVIKPYLQIGEELSSPPSWDHFNSSQIHVNCQPSSITYLREAFSLGFHYLKPSQLSAFTYLRLNNSSHPIAEIKVIHGKQQKKNVRAPRMASHGEMVMTGASLSMSTQLAIDVSLASTSSFYGLFVTPS